MFSKNSREVLFIFTLLLLISLSLTGCGGGGGGQTNTNPTPKRIAYVYATNDGSIPATLANLLSAYKITGVTMGQIDSTDFSKFNLIIIGPETSNSSPWGSGTQAASIDNAGKPIIGMGDGGSYFFQEINQPNFKSDQCMQNHQNNVVVINASNAIWSTPNSISTGAGSVTVTLPTGGMVREAYIPNIPADIRVLGREPASANHYIIAKQGRYMLWGLCDGADQYTSDGKKLLANAVYLMMP